MKMQVLLALCSLMVLSVSEDVIAEHESCEVLKNIHLTNINTEMMVSYSANSCDDDSSLMGVMCEGSTCRGFLQNIGDVSEHAEIATFHVTETNGTFAVAYAGAEVVKVRILSSVTTIPVAAAPTSISISYNEESNTHIVLWSNDIVMESILLMGTDSYSWVQPTTTVDGDDLLAGLRNPKTLPYSSFFMVFAQRDNQIVVAVLDASTGYVVGTVTPVQVQSSPAMITDFSITLSNDTVIVTSAVRLGPGSVVSVTLVSVNVNEAGELIVAGEQLLEDYYSNTVLGTNSVKTAVVTILDEESLAIGVSVGTDIRLTLIDIASGNISSSFNKKVIVTTDGYFPFDIITNINEGLSVVYVTQMGVHLISEVDTSAIASFTNNPTLVLPDVVVVVVEDDDSSSLNEMLLSVLVMVVMSCCIGLVYISFIIIKRNSPRQIKVPNHIVDVALLESKML
eukprot:TRINITY_DN4242_c1_g1_i1.p1 TRINITY_DN4242_c1_g1~~TRINITY_DN4242_c1_g1_i1.p1  ORF type:complete len:453 (+),score=97.81 TRINITY_DN4242_c1_g1_i1:70-1428(+)